MNIVDLRQKNNADQPASPAGEREISVDDQRLIGGVAGQHINPQKRQFLKLLLIGIGGFFLGRLFGPIIKLLRPSDFKEVLIKIPEPEKDIATSERSIEIPGPEKEVELQNWKIVEGGNQVIFIDKKTKEEVLILD